MTNIGKTIRNITLYAIVLGSAIGISSCGGGKSETRPPTHGCDITQLFKETEEGVYQGTINPGFYLNHTGIKVKSGDNLDTELTGAACWGPSPPCYYPNCYNLCAWPAGNKWTWGVWRTFLKPGIEHTEYLQKIGSGASDTVTVPPPHINDDGMLISDVINVNESVNFSDNDVYEMVFVIPDGSTTDLCHDDVRADNTGSYSAVVKVNK